MTSHNGERVLTDGHPKNSKKVKYILLNGRKDSQKFSYPFTKLFLPQQIASANELSGLKELNAQGAEIKESQTPASVFTTSKEILPALEKPVSPLLC